MALEMLGAGSVERPRGETRPVVPLMLAGALMCADLWVCPFAALWSVPCPGCGLTRAALLLLRGDWLGAWRMHPLSPLLVPLFGLLLAAELVGAVRGRAPWDRAAWRRHADRAAPLLLALLLGVWLARCWGCFAGPVPLE